MGQFIESQQLLPTLFLLSFCDHFKGLPCEHASRAFVQWFASDSPEPKTHPKVEKHRTSMIEYHCKKYNGHGNVWWLKQRLPNKISLTGPSYWDQRPRKAPDLAPTHHFSTSWSSWISMVGSLPHAASPIDPIVRLQWACLLQHNEPRPHNFTRSPLRPPWQELPSAHVQLTIFETKIYNSLLWWPIPCGKWRLTICNYMFIHYTILCSHEVIKFKWNLEHRTHSHRNMDSHRGPPLLAGIFPDRLWVIG